MFIEKHESSESHQLEEEILAIVGTKNSLLEIVSGLLAECYIYGRILKQTEITGLATLALQNVYGGKYVGEVNENNFQYEIDSPHWGSFVFM